MMKQGDKFEKQFVVSSEVYEGFIKIFKDQNELHTNKEFAQSKGFKSEVMHGNILNGFLSYFVGECLPVRNVIIHSQEIKYPNPMYLGDQITLKVEVADVFESVNAIEFRFQFQNENNLPVGKGKIQVGLLSTSL